MYTAKLKNIEKEKKIYLIALLMSAIIHLLFLLFFKFEIFDFDIAKNVDDTPEEVTIVFPENKPEERPRQVVENINENEDMPERSDLLSDRNSRAANPQLSDLYKNQPMSEGNIPFPNLTSPNQAPSPSKFIPTKKFSKDALRKSNTTDDSENFYKIKDKDVAQAMRDAAREQQTTNNIYKQKKFSSDQMGNLTLSTYAWEWAPYINAMKRKLMQVWFPPAAYLRLGIIHGETMIRFTVSRDGRLLGYKVLNHNGHESLETSSVNAINSLFPFKPLPQNFPDDNLTITARLIYTNLKEGYR